MVKTLFDDRDSKTPNGGVGEKSQVGEKTVSGDLRH